MRDIDKSNIVIGFLIAIVTGILFTIFDSEVAKFTSVIRENSFETLVILFLVIIFILLLRLHVKINEKITLE